MKKLAWLAILFSLIFPWNAFAQGEYQAVVFSPRLQEFPRVTTYLDVHASDGAFVHGLDPDLVFMLEDGKSIPVDELQELRMGVQISVVINASPAFALRNNRGQARYDYVKQYIETWALSQRNISTDDLNLFTNSPINQLHLSDSLAFQSAFATYQPDLRQAVPSLEPLTAAIQAAMDYQPDQPIEKAILYFAPLPGEEMTDTVRLDLISRAKQARARIFVWMIASQFQFDSPEAAHLRSLANDTGGVFFAFSGNEPFSEAQKLIDPLRFIYQIGYTSLVRDSGTHKLATRINLSESMITALPISFNINLQPPNPIFVGLPPSIHRSAPENSKNLLQDLAPASHTVEFLLEFPDGYTREISKARLVVDGSVMAENSIPPLNRFVWDLTPYTSTAPHELQVVVEDSLGFTASSSVLITQVNVTLPDQNPWMKFLTSGGIYALLVVFFLLGLLAARGVDNWRQYGALIRPKNYHPPQQVVVATPTGQMDMNYTEGSGLPSKFFTASLKLLNSEMQPVGDPPIYLEDEPVSWGKDQDRVSIWLDDDTLNDYHCDITRAEDGGYLLKDHKTIAGTWVNYAPVPETGHPLIHGDVIQVGDLTYRYEENPPRKQASVEVKPYNSSQ